MRRVRDLSCGDTRVYLGIEVRRVRCRSCKRVRCERLDFLADNPLYTKRFARFVGRRCRASTIQDVAKELHLDWHTVKAPDKQYMKAQLERAGTRASKAIGIDEISIRKGHTDRIVVSDLIRGRPIKSVTTLLGNLQQDVFYVRGTARAADAVIDASRNVEAALEGGTRSFSFVTSGQVTVDIDWQETQNGTNYDHIRCAPWRAKRRRVVRGRRRRGRMAVVARDREVPSRRRAYASASDTPSSHLRECCVASAERATVWRSGTDAGRPGHNRLS